MYIYFIGFWELLFADFMDALSDPRAYLSAQEKRTEQLKAIGVDENDINTNDVIATKKTAGSGSGGSRAGGGHGTGAGNAPSAGGGGSNTGGLPTIPGILPTKKPLEKGTQVVKEYNQCFRSMFLK